MPLGAASSPTHSAAKAARFALITTEQTRLPAKEPNDWEQIQNSFISLTDRTFLLNSGLKTFYISVSFTHYCSHSYLCKPRNHEPASSSNLLAGEGPHNKEAPFEVF